MVSLLVLWYLFKLSKFRFSCRLGKVATQLIKINWGGRKEDDNESLHLDYFLQYNSYLMKKTRKKIREYIPPIYLLSHRWYNTNRSEKKENSPSWISKHLRFQEYCKCNWIRIHISTSIYIHVYTPLAHAPPPHAHMISMRKF